MSENHKLIGVTWFSGRGTVGIVLVEDIITGTLKSWIKSVTGEDEKASIEDIISWGTKFPVKAAILLINERESAWSSFYVEELMRKPQAW